MASSSALVKFCALAVMCIVMAAPLAEALTCGQVSTNLAPCLGYLRGGPGPSGPCCNGVKTLKSLAGTTADKKTACNCLKAAAGGISGLKYNLASGLPSKCGASIPYTISPNTDCSKIQ